MPEYHAGQREALAKGWLFSLNHTVMCAPSFTRCKPHHHSIQVMLASATLSRCRNSPSLHLTLTKGLITARGYLEDGKVNCRILSRFYASIQERASKQPDKRNASSSSERHSTASATTALRIPRCVRHESRLRIVPQSNLGRTKSGTEPGVCHLLSRRPTCPWALLCAIKAESRANSGQFRRPKRSFASVILRNLFTSESRPAEVTKEYFCASLSGVNA